MSTFKKCDICSKRQKKKDESDWGSISLRIPHKHPLAKKIDPFGMGTWDLCSACAEPIVAKTLTLLNKKTKK